MRGGDEVIGRLGEGEIEGRVIVFSGQSLIFVILSETKDPYRDQEINNPRLTDDKAFVTCTLDGFLAWLGMTNK